MFFFDILLVDHVVGPADFGSNDPATPSLFNASTLSGTAATVIWPKGPWVVAAWLRSKTLHVGCIQISQGFGKRKGVSRL